MAEDDVKDVIKLLEGDRCLVTVWRIRVAEQTKYVVAARGTRLKSLGDLIEDFHIAFEQLHGRTRVTCIYTLVCKLIERYGRQSVILTGHSLGAAVTYQVCRQLYLKGSEVEGHFFELPFMTLDKVLEKYLALCELEFVCLKTALEVLRLKPRLDCLRGKLIERSARLLKFDVDAAQAEYDLLRGWHPYIYVQKYDDISNEYIDFFSYNCTHSDGRGMSRITAILKKVGAGAQACHLLPSAYLITSDKGVGTLTSHVISNWTDAKLGRVQGAMYTDRNRVRVIE